MKGGRRKTEGEKNTTKDVDNESYSLQEFFDLIAHGQTVAIDMLFAPDENLEVVTPLWRYIQKNAEKLLTNKSAAFVGYCRTQANKYGIKGSRVAAARDAADAFQELYDFHGPATKVGECARVIHRLVSTNPEHMRIVEKYDIRSADKRVETYFECCNRQIPFTASIKLACELYGRIHKGYGQRAQLAMQNEGIDWKALSHAVRVGEEAIELMATGKITFPLRNAEWLKSIKLGEVSYTTVAREIESLLAEVEQGSQHSVLRDEPDYEFIDETVKGQYLYAVLGDNQWVEEIGEKHAIIEG